MRRTAAALSVIAVLGLSSPGLAQPTPSQPTPAELSRAKAHFQEGDTFYQMGEFEAAVVEYKAAYALAKRPALLFNIAQAYRLKGDFEQALYFYRSFLRNAPASANRTEVEKLAAEVEEKLERQRREAAEAERRDREAKAAAEREDGERDRAESEGSSVAALSKSSGGNPTLRTAGLATAGVGLVALGAGAFFGLKARSQWSDIDDLAAGGGRWSDEFTDKWNSAEKSESLAAGLLLGGSAAIVAGGVLYFLGRDGGTSAEVAPVAVTPTLGGAQVTVRW